MNPIRILFLGGLALSSLSGTGESQVSVRDVRHVRWPLIDLVMAPDSAWGVLLLAAPNTGTVQWQDGSSLVKLRLDPVYALQWATRSRELMREDSVAAAQKATRVAPALQSRKGGAFLLVGRQEEGPAEERFVLVVSDTGSKTQWKTFAGVAQMDALLASLEQTGERAWAVASTRDSSEVADEEDFDQPVSVVSQPIPKYPYRLAYGGRQGRVWMMYVVGPNGRPEPGSFQPLLSDDSLFTQAAIKALMRSKFKPAQKDGQPVRQRVFQIIRFEQR